MLLLIGVLFVCYSTNNWACCLFAIRPMSGGVSQCSASRNMLLLIGRAAVRLFAIPPVSGGGGGHVTITLACCLFSIPPLSGGGR